MARRIRFKQYEFDPDSGLLLRTDVAEESESNPKRLAPQPCRLLELLLMSYPDMVSRDTIRETLWPDVQVDFERSLHYCIRQVRVALGESAADPQYIETIPRRGYRWLLPLEAAAGESADGESSESDSDNGNSLPDAIDPVTGVAVSTDERDGCHSDLLEHPCDLPDFPLSEMSGEPRFRIPWLAASAFLLLLATILFLRRDDDLGERDPHVRRIAIMPLRPQLEGASGFVGNQIAEEVLAQLMDPPDERLEVIGPTTTQSYDGPPQRVRSLVEELDIDFVINGKFSYDDNGTDRVLAEIIRSDGAHVWTHHFHVEQRTLIPQLLVTKLRELIEEASH